MAQNLGAEMPRQFRLALAQINSTVGDISGNTQTILKYIDMAREAKADLVAFPELAITGYPPEDLLLKPAFLQANLDAMQRVIAAAKGIAVVVGFVHVARDTSNAAAIGYDGNLIDIYRKIFLPNYGVFDEDRYFRRGDTCPVYTINGTGVGINICEDIWYPVGPAVLQRESGAEVIVNINASPFYVEKGYQKEKMIATRAMDNGVFVAYLNTIGGQDELVFDGASVIYNMDGEKLAQGAFFQEEMVVADLDVESVFRSRLRDPRPRKENPAMLDEIGKARTIQVSGFEPKSYLDLPTVVPSVSLTTEEEVYQALVLGTRDYVLKSGFTKTLVGLSGGIDSALTSVIAADALGPENVIGVTMPSRYSSEGSVSDSEHLAKNLGIQIWNLPIELAHTAFSEMLDPYFEGTNPGVAEENLQARIRGNVIMSLSNKFGWLVLTTGNKSEMAMGYATLYGDMAGGFAVLKDVPKTLVYRLSNWRNQSGTPSAVIPEAIITKPPSAELKPDQLDQDTLPPYDYLDPIIKAYVEDDLSYLDMIQLGFDPAIVKQVMSYVDRNEYKRRQAPPGVKITPRAFGKDRRLPIVNSYRQF
jgi:NAD+ synthase (glutamine-hydrolysing)|tara:strand:- start:36 stop:1802 length:1767 start_codon:yes stop_codon:yes gene_type:complete